MDGCGARDELLENKENAPVTAVPGAYPLTDAQAEKWLGARYSAQSNAAFNLAFELELEGALDESALADAVTATFAEHEASAMRFPDDGAAQIHQPGVVVAVEPVDLSDDPDPAARYASFRDEAVAQPLDMARAPLFRVWLCRLSGKQHRLVVSAHHLVADGWSMRVLLQGFAARYNRARRGCGRVPAADSWTAFVVAQDALRQGEQGQRAMAYWRDRFADPLEPLDLPADGARGSHMDFSAAIVEQDIAPELWTRAKQAARRHGVTRFGVLLAGYLLLLGKLCGRDDVACAVPFTSAARGRGARVIGDTGDTLPLRVELEPGDSIPGLLKRVDQALKEAASHQDVSLGRIVQALRLTPEPGRMTLVSTLFTLNPAIETIDFDGLSARLRVLPQPATAWEMAWQVRPMKDRVLLEVQYHRALFQASTVQGWCDAYLRILEALSMPAPGDVAGIDAAPPGAGSLVDSDPLVASEADPLPVLLAHSFARFGDRFAASCGSDRVDYAALDRASCAVASALQQRGIGRGDLVGVCLPRSIDMLVAVLGVMRSGAAYVPLDPAFPEDRLQWMAEHSRLRLILATSAGQVPAGVSAGREILQIDVAKAASVQVLPRIERDDLAYVLYTSGSTGMPKGVGILHGNLANFLLSMRRQPGFAENDVLCSATTLSFDIAALELYLPLLCGGEVVIADEEEYRDPERLSNLIARSGATVFQTTPSLLSLLLEVRREQVLRPLKLLVGGEAMPAALAARIVPLCRELWNMYGPTETTVWSTIARVADPGASIPLGKPIANTRIHVLDAVRKPVVPGAIGEIWIGGDGVASGYLHRPDLTAERFLPDVSAGGGSRMYRTGDLGRISAGELHFHGRVDDQIKLRGFRIEPGEIESAAAADPAVAECVVVVKKLDNGDGVLVLYVAARGDEKEVVPRLRERLASVLPPYMRPHRIVTLQALPKTPNGKVDRKALPEPTVDETQAGVARPAVATSRDPVERELAMLWQRLLQRSHVAPDDHFFEMGGYSMLAVRMFAEIHERYGVDLPLSALIENPTVAELANAIRNSGQAVSDRPNFQPARAMEGSSSLVELEQGGPGAPLFLLHAIGGNVLNYLAIAQAVAPQRTAYGIQSRGLNGGETPVDDFGRMADNYATEISRVHPDGPCLLAGGSMGGALALEVARRLVDAGREVAFLGLIDTYGPGMPGGTGFRPFKLWRWPSLYLSMDRKQRSALHRRIVFRCWHLPALLVRAWLERHGAAPQALRIHRVERANQKALNGYRPAPYPGNVVLFRASHSTGLETPLLGWDGYVGGAHTIELEGRHDNIIEQPELAERMRECLHGL